MSSNSRKLSHGQREGMLSAISVGFFIILVGTIFVLNPNLANGIADFAHPDSFELEKVVPSLNVTLPIPKDPRAHLLIYQTVEQFCLVWAVFLVAMLAVRFILHSPARNKAENLGGIIFWFGAAYFVQTLLVDSARLLVDIARTRWVEFWAIIIALIGISLFARGVFLLAASKIRKIE